MELNRYDPKPNIGLSQEQVDCRFAEHLTNLDTTPPTKSLKNIFFQNICTLFNLINILLGAAIIYVGAYKNLLFLFVILINIIIGITQEIRAKKAVDKLAIIAVNKVKVIRGGKTTEIDISEIVLDDIIILKAGDQVPADAVVLENQCNVNESLLTGESDTIYKGKGDMLLSGSFLTGGNVVAKVEHVGKENYAATILDGAKYIKKIKSEIMSTLKKIVEYISIIIVPIGAILFFNQFHLKDATLRSSVVNTVAALVGMIPEGLVLLTSTVLAIAVIRLSNRKVLVRDLFTIESLARVDVLCLDKTGTITEGTMELSKTVPLCNSAENEVEETLNLLMNIFDDDNATIHAIKERYNNNTDVSAEKIFSFSSETKWSGATIKGTTYILGAPEFVLPENISKIQDELNQYADDFRVLLLAKTEENMDNGTIPSNIAPMALILLKDKIRKQAKETLQYFIDNDVDLKVISGDGINTVRNIAKAAGLPNYNGCIDMCTIKTEEELKNVAETYSVFGRVTPVQKRDLIKAMKENGHTVAMTGDGVNDVLALKESDCSVAIASGSEAARNVAQLVLLNSDFEAMPSIVEEGRRSINNVQRSAALFLVKTIYSTVLAILFLFVKMRYPFELIQMTLVSTFTIGIPSFVLALEPNHERVSGRFIKNILLKAVPGAVSIVLNIMLLMWFKYTFGFSHIETSTMAVILTSFSGILLLYRLCMPFNKLRITLIFAMVLGLSIGLSFFHKFFSFTALHGIMLLILFVLLIISFVIFNLFYNLFNRKNSVKQKYKS